MKNTQTLNLNLFRFEIGTHKENNVIWIHFPKNFDVLKHLKSFTKPRWSQSQLCWYVPDKIHYRDLFNLEKKILGKQALLQIHPINLHALTELQNEIILRGLSQNTLRSYSTEFAQLLSTIKDFPVENLTSEKIKAYLLYCVTDLGVSENYLHSRINALKFYFEKVLRREKIFLEIPRPKKPEILPKSLNPSEITKIISVTENAKHQTIIKLCYGMGLRVSEIVNLKIEDIDSKSMRVLISKAKGKKDRYVNLPESILPQLRDYYREFRPKEFLFEGQDGGRYSVRSAQNVFKNAMKKAGIHKTVGIHSLRHSYATHLLEYGTDISLIQKLLGHNQISTTLNYTKIVDKHLRKVESPLDRL